MKVKDIMQRNPYSIPPDTTVEDAAKIMKQKNIGSLLIEKKEKVIGIITEGDLVRKVLAEGKNGSDIFVNEIKSFPLIKIHENEDVVDATFILTKYNIRRLVVINEEGIVGIISQGIIGRHIHALIHEK